MKNSLPETDSKGKGIKWEFEGEEKLLIEDCFGRGET